MGNQGTGLTQNAPKKMLVLITDGARSNRRSNPRTVWPIDEPISGNGNGPSPGNCQAIRSQGFTLAVINIKYADLSGDHWFDYHLGTSETLVKPDGSTVTSSVYSELPAALSNAPRRLVFRGVGHRIVGHRRGDGATYRHDQQIESASGILGMAQDYPKPDPQATMAG
jgi:hypothetical protein